MSAINHPDHYQGSDGLEVIDVMKNFLTEDQFQGFLVGNVIKYVLRSQHKHGVEDLKKAQWYLGRIIEDTESQ